MSTGWYPHVAAHRTLDHQLAEDGPKVLAELGYDEAARDELRAAGVV
jgi:hypothetical protein